MSIRPDGKKDKETGRGSSSSPSSARTPAHLRYGMPITHSAPVNPTTAVEIRLPAKRHLGVDDNPSWIVVAEGNEFLWPGYDCRKLPHSDRYDHGFLPPHFFNQVLDAFVDWYKRNRRRITPRK